MASSDCVELVTSLYRYLFFDILSTHIHICVLKILSDNKTNLKSLFVFIHECAIYIKDIGSEILVSISVDFTELSQIDSLYYSVSQIDSSFWVNLGTSN